MNIEIKQLDQRLIESANMHSFGGKRGDIDAHEYEVYCYRVLSWGLSERQTQKIIDKVYQYFSRSLSLDAQHVSVAVAGASNYNAKRLDKTDQILKTSSEFCEWFEEMAKQATRKEYSRVEELEKQILFGECAGFAVTKEWKELAARDRTFFEKLYKVLDEKTPFKKQTMAYKLYHRLAEVEPIVTKVLYQDNDFKVFEEQGKIFIAFRLIPMQQLKVALKSRRFFWNNTYRAWQATATDELREWVQTIAERYEQYI